ncbi:glycosyltransferase [Gaopeijia maritima]|uniref:Glycosyltransferase n=1 Tax=Gaopeijia maritima TaxID=3119007 RepID=A0ABU9ECK8_9BACT
MPAKNGRVRVLHCIQNLNYGGMERVLSDLVRGVDHDAFEPHVLTLQYRGRYGEGLDGHATLHDGPDQGPLAMIQPVQLANAIADIDPDVVHLHSGVWYKAVRASRLAGVPRVVYTEHGRRPPPEALLTRVLDGFAARVTDHIVAVSEATSVQLQDGPKVPAERIHVIPNGIDTDRFSPGPSTFRAAHGISDDTVLIGSVGRLEPVKGYATLLRGLRTLLDRADVKVPVHLVMAGDGSQREELEALAGTLDLCGHVTFLGWWDDPEGLLRALDVFALTSVSEGTSISLLEAMSTGCCPVVTRVGGNPHVLGDELAHRMVESKDPESVGAGLADAVIDRERRVADGDRGRRRVNDVFAVNRMVEAYSRLYTEQ